MGVILQLNKRKDINLIQTDLKMALTHQIVENRKQKQIYQLSFGFHNNEPITNHSMSFYIIHYKAVPYLNRLLCFKSYFYK
jgi:hypothetical protein